jgi:hypothetical protein
VFLLSHIIWWARELAFYRANGWDFNIDRPGSDLIAGDPVGEKIPNNTKVFVFIPVVLVFSALAFVGMVYVVWFQ